MIPLPVKLENHCLECLVFPHMRTIGHPTLCSVLSTEVPSNWMEPKEVTGLPGTHFGVTSGLGFLSPAFLTNSLYTRPLRSFSLFQDMDMVSALILRLGCGWVVYRLCFLIC